MSFTLILLIFLLKTIAFPAFQVEEQQRLRHLSKRRTPAALLIQTIWRYYSLDKKSTNRMVLRKGSISNSKTYLRKNSANAEQNALKFILVVKYFIARRKFSEALKPYDIKDIVEQYASGHSDMLFRIKQIESKMDSIEAIVRSNRNTLQDLKHLTSSRMSKVEELLKDLNNRLNDFKELNPIEKD